MSYATGRAFCDADSHLMETPDWLVRYAEPHLRDRLLPLSLGKGGAAPDQKIADALARVKDPAATQKIAQDVIAGPKGWGAYGAFTASERSKALDDLGFSRQLVFTTFAATQFLWRRSRTSCTAAFAHTIAPSLTFARPTGVSSPWAWYRSTIPLERSSKSMRQSS